MRALAMLLLLYGCGGSSSPSPDLAGDLAPAVDFATSPDLAQPHTTSGIACGTTPCAANAQFCCTSTSGTTGSCGQGDDATSCEGSRFYCDGSEDCPPALHNCCITDGVATCTDSACTTQAEGGGQLCHGDVECGGSKCCSSSETPYELCLPSCS